MACQGFGIDVSGLLPILIDILDIVLTIIGLIPAPVPIAGQVGTVADAVTVVLNTVNSDPLATALSIVALVPVPGPSQLGGGLKIIYKVARVLTYLIGSPLLQIGFAIGVISLISMLYYFIYFL